MTSSEQLGRLKVLVWLLIATCSGAVFYGNLRFQREVLAVGLEDDFFYYAEAARHLASQGISTFDGVHLTNGYHPLWMLLLTALTWLSHGASAIYPFAIELETVQFALVLGIGYFSYRICNLFGGAVASICIQLLVVSWSLVLVRTGMEVGLTLLVALAMLWFRLQNGFSWSARNTFYYGLLASVMVLSRLDSILLVTMLFLFDVVPQPDKGLKRLRNSALFGFGMGPVAVYAVINEDIFHTLMPISGTAKQLRLHHTPSLAALKSFMGYVTARNSPLLGLAIFVTLFALFFLLKSTVRLKAYGVLVSVLLFPMVHLVAISSMSDWPLWQWYLYPWLLSSIVASAVLLSVASEHKLVISKIDRPAYVYLCGIYLVAYAALVAGLSNPKNNLPYVAAAEISEFAQHHDGTYAMGDRSGTVGYLSGRPVLQLEGLMMDKQYLENIRAQKDLLEVLKQYKVRYYIATRAVRDGSGCWAVKEPWQAGADSPAMKARICRQPVEVLAHGNFVNTIFDLQSPTMR